MSTNHFSTEAPWWAQHQQQHHHMMEPSMKSSSRKQNATTNSQLYHHQNAANTTATMFCTQNTAFSLNLNGHEDDEELDELQVTDEREKEEQEQEEEHIPKEALFEKPLTPSDVGKLNRLVIPKQHAEKYFPLSSSNNDSGEKGLLLSFEDESGKSWRFRYSYWNSSQSYVLTKGWSRFVKEKRLDAGDIVMFERHRFDGDRFFIGWRRRNTPANPVHDGGVAQPSTAPGGGGGWNQMLYSGHPYPSQPHGPQLPYQPDCVHAGSVVQNQTAPSGHFKTLRLFGVNLECQPDQDQSEPSTPDGSSTSSHQGPTHHHQFQYDQNYSKSQPYVHHNHMEINFSRDVNQMGYHQR